MKKTKHTNKFTVSLTFNKRPKLSHKAMQEAILDAIVDFDLGVNLFNDIAEISVTGIKKPLIYNARIPRP